MIPCSKDTCRGSHCRPVARGGVTYRCAQALADALGVTRSAVYQSLHRFGDAEHCGRKVFGRKGGPRKQVQVGPHSWPTITAMARDLGVSRRQLGINLRAAPERVLSLVMRIKG